MIDFEDLKNLFKECKTFEAQYKPTFRKVLKLMGTDDLLCAFEKEQYDKYKSALSTQQMKHMRSLGDKLTAEGMIEGEIPWKNEKVISIEEKGSKSSLSKKKENDTIRESDVECAESDDSSESSESYELYETDEKKIDVDTESELSLSIDNITNGYLAEITDLKTKNHDLLARNQELLAKCRTLYGLLQIYNKECKNLDVVVEINRCLFEHIFETM